jgi:hypothetical protein
VALVSFVLCSPSEGASRGSRGSTPNIVLIFADDLGYADIGPFGATAYKTPHLDRLAKEGRRFTSFYTAQPVCSASRAALLTGCYPNRIGIAGALGPRSAVGIHSNEVTLPNWSSNGTTPRPFLANGTWDITRNSCPPGMASTSITAFPTRMTCGRVIPKPKQGPIPTCR